MEKLKFRGTILSIQPRIRLIRSFDEFSHAYSGYVLRISGATDQGKVTEEEGKLRKFSVAIGKGTQSKYQFQAGDQISGLCLPVPDERLETAQYYKVCMLAHVTGKVDLQKPPPPWTGIPPDLETYRNRGHRRLASRTYSSKCSACIWGCRMPVQIIIDHWEPEKKEYRFETFCYGPLSCNYYKPGPTRKVKGRKGMIYEEEDWVDEEMTGHRCPDE